MKRIFTLAIVTLVATIVLGGKASAQSAELPSFYPVDSQFTFNFMDLQPQFAFEQTEPVTLIEEVTEPEPEPEPQPIIHTVVAGDNLSKIAEQYDTTWIRLWEKNKNIQHQDVLNIGEKLEIPTPDEDLEKRRPITPVVVQTPVRTALSESKISRTPVNYSSSGNTYGYGYCTWYVKNRRPDLPNGLGNANTWYSRASSFGLATGTTPRAGAVGTTTRGALGHVVYVERVNGDGTITISDMNYAGWNVVTTRTVSASQFVYIY